MSAAGGLISVLVGTVVLRLTVEGTYRRYVRESMGPWLALAGVVIVVVGVVTVVAALRRGRTDTDDGRHDHGHRERAGWLLLVPIATLLLVAPPTLGSYGVDRGATVDVSAGASVFEPLAGPGPVPMTLLEYGQRAFDRDGASLEDTTVELTGFVVDDGGGGGDGDGGAFRLARYQIACCAADATPVVVRIVGVHGDPPARDRWVAVTGRFQPGGDPVPALAATSIVEVDPPEDPYE